MKNLWTVLPPLLSDNFGFVEVVRKSDGLGIIDDSGEYRLGGSGGGHGGRGGKGGDFHKRPFDGSIPNQRDGAASWHGHGEGHGEGRGEGHGDFHGGRDGHGGGGRHGGTDRVVVSGADSQDVVNGTKDKLIEAFQRGQSRYDPKFVLFSAGPCGAMIGTDLDDVSHTVGDNYNIPAASVELTGQKLYDYGISKTLETLVKLLTKPSEKKNGVINILGATALDFSDEDITALTAWANSIGFEVNAVLGSSVTSDAIEKISSAQVNLVVTAAGLTAARYLEKKYGTPFVAAAPLGADLQKKLSDALKEGASVSPVFSEVDADTLIIGEQFIANSVREALITKGICENADVASFFTLDKAFSSKNDKKLRSEDDLSALINSGKYKRIIADPLMKNLLTVNTTWIDLPHRAFNTYDTVSGISLVGDKLDSWISDNL
jgi:hypothetical protein